MASSDAMPAIRLLTSADAAAFRELRLTALASAPEAFGSSYAEEAAQSVESFHARIPDVGPDAIFGAFAEGWLVGTSGFAANQRAKHRHKGLLWGVFVQPQWRGRGLGERLVRHVIAHACEHVLLLHATVGTSNQTARALYHRLGFVPYGIERQALCIDGVFYDEELLVANLPRLTIPTGSGEHQPPQDRGSRSPR